MDIGAIILAGGKSSRMGSDKGLMVWNGKPMIAHVIHATQKITSDILVVTNNEEYTQFGLPVFPDEQTDKGPLAGLLSGLRKTKYEYNLVLSCDIPGIQPEVLNYLFASCSGYDITLLRVKDDVHPLIGVYRTTCIPIIESQLQNGQLRLKDLFKLVQTQILSGEQFDQQNFRNLNSPEDL